MRGRPRVKLKAKAMSQADLCKVRSLFKQKVCFGTIWCFVTLRVRTAFVDCDTLGFSFGRMLGEDLDEDAELDVRRRRRRPDPRSHPAPAVRHCHRPSAFPRAGQVDRQYDYTNETTPESAEPVDEALGEALVNETSINVTSTETTALEAETDVERESSTDASDVDEDLTGVGADVEIAEAIALELNISASAVEIEQDLFAPPPPPPPPAIDVLSPALWRA